MARTMAACVQTHEQRRKPMANSDRPSWTALDIGGLRDGFRENLSIADIAGQLLRTEADVAGKALELGIRLRLA